MYQFPTKQQSLLSTRKCHAPSRLIPNPYHSYVISMKTTILHRRKNSVSTWPSLPSHSIALRCSMLPASPGWRQNPSLAPGPVLFEGDASPWVRCAGSRHSHSSLIPWVGVYTAAARAVYSWVDTPTHLGCIDSTVIFFGGLFASAGVEWLRCVEF